MDYQHILKDLKNGQIKPIYFLCGEEEYFIDRISDYIEEKLLSEEEKSFNQTILYGLETDEGEILSAAKRFPMMSKYNLIIVKEAQTMKKWESLGSYFENPLESTVLVICHKYKKPDGRNKSINKAKIHGVWFESKKLYENQVIPWVEGYVKSHGYSIEPKASYLLVESTGFELSKISNEIDKLLIGASKKEAIGVKQVSDNIGLSKEYNVFELNAAMGSRNEEKANRIIHHFGKNEKNYALPLVLPAMYRFFSQVLLYHVLKGGAPQTIARGLGVNPFFIKDYQRAAQNYSVKHLARIISALKKADLHSKGVGNKSASNYDILKELIHAIFHPQAAKKN